MPFLPLICRGPLTLRKLCTEGQTPEPLLEGRGVPGGGGEDPASEQPRYRGPLGAHTRTADSQDGLWVPVSLWRISFQGGIFNAHKRTRSTSLGSSVGQCQKGKTKTVL